MTPLKPLAAAAAFMILTVTACGKANDAVSPPLHRQPNVPVAVVTQSASTNTPAVVVDLFANGTAIWHIKAMRTETRGRTLIRHHFARVRLLVRELRLVGSVRAIDGRKAQCMKSVSFGTTLTVEYRGETSPDLLCLSASASPRVLKIASDAQKLVYKTAVPPSP